MAIPALVAPLSTSPTEVLPTRTRLVRRGPHHPPLHESTIRVEEWSIWWGAHLGTDEQLATGWVMDDYLVRAP